jgi:Predicted O-methyltransferase
MQNTETFRKVKKLCHGYLDAGIYEEIYKHGVSAEEGIVVDIGPAQGGSTISLGLALRENTKLKKIYSIDTFCNSAALISSDDIQKNIDQLYSNLNEYGLSNYVTTIVSGRDNLNFIKDNEKISVLFIDADGALDRDFKLYYNHLTDGAFIIIDDCANEINFHASTRYLAYKGVDSIDLFLSNIKLKSLAEYTPLGKQYTTFKFVEYFVNKGFLEKINFIDNTIFLRKPLNAPVLSDENIEDLDNIRKEIESDYFKRNKIMRSFYDRFSKYLAHASEILNADVAYMFENHFYNGNNKWITVQVDIWEKEPRKENLLLYPVYFDYIESLITVLKSGEIYCKNVNEIQEFELKTYFEQLGFKSVIAAPIFVNDYFWGLMLFLGKNNLQIQLNEVNEAMKGMVDLTVNDIVKYKEIKEAAVSLVL